MDLEALSPYRGESNGRHDACSGLKVVSTQNSYVAALTLQGDGIRK